MLCSIEGAETACWDEANIWSGNRWKSSRIMNYQRWYLRTFLLVISLHNVRLRSPDQQHGENHLIIDQIRYNTHVILFNIRLCASLLEDINVCADNRIYFSIKCFLNGNNAGANSNLTTPVAWAAYRAVFGFDSQPIGTFSWATATRINGEVMDIKSNFKWEVTIHENTKKILISQFQEGKSM